MDEEEGADVAAEEQEETRLTLPHPVLSSHIARFSQYFGGGAEAEQQEETTYDHSIGPQEEDDDEELSVTPNKKQKMDDHKPMDAEDDPDL